MNKRFISIFIIVAILFSLSVSAAEIRGQGIVTADVLNIRKTPDMDGEVISRLKTGEKVDIITKTGEWYEILFEDELSYVHSDYIIASRNEMMIAAGDEDEIEITVQSFEGMEKGEAVVEFAKSFLGTPYQWGGETPEEGFDCSGLVFYVYGQFGVDLYRVACDQAKNGTAVNLEALMPGDIVLFWNRASYSEINHVGIYVGDGSFIHAPQTGDVVKITTLESGYYAKNLVEARRIFE